LSPSANFAALSNTAAASAMHAINIILISVLCHRPTHRGYLFRGRDVINRCSSLDRFIFEIINYLRRARDRETGRHVITQCCNWLYAAASSGNWIDVGCHLTALLRRIRQFIHNITDNVPSIMLLQLICYVRYIRYLPAPVGIIVVKYVMKRWMSRLQTCVYNAELPIRY